MSLTKISKITIRLGQLRKFRYNSTSKRYNTNQWFGPNWSGKSWELQSKLMRTPDCIIILKWDEMPRESEINLLLAWYTCNTLMIFCQIRYLSRSTHQCTYMVKMFSNLVLWTLSISLSSKLRWSFLIAGTKYFYIFPVMQKGPVGNFDQNNLLFYFWMYNMLRLSFEILSRKAIKISSFWDRKHSVYAAVSLAAKVTSWYSSNGMQKNFFCFFFLYRNTKCMAQWLLGANLEILHCSDAFSRRHIFYARQHFQTNMCRFCTSKIYRYFSIKRHSYSQGPFCVARLI